MVRLTIRFLVLDMYMGSLKAKSLERTQRCMHFYGVESDERWHATRIAQTTGAMLQDLLAKPLENVQSHGVQIFAMGSRFLPQKYHDLQPDACRQACSVEIDKVL